MVEVKRYHIKKSCWLTRHGNGVREESRRIPRFWLEQLDEWYYHSRRYYRETRLGMGDNEFNLGYVELERKMPKWMIETGDSLVNTRVLNGGDRSLHHGASPYISFFPKTNMKLPAADLYAPLLGYIISDCSPCENYNSTEYEMPVLKAMMVWMERLGAHIGPHLMTECFISCFLLKLFGQTLGSVHFLFWVWEAFLIEMFFMAENRNNSMLQVSQGHLKRRNLICKDIRGLLTQKFNLAIYPRPLGSYSCFLVSFYYCLHKL